MRPLDPKLADQHFVIGERYILVVAVQRSDESHSHYFGVVNYAWENLPHDVAAQFPDAESLRHRALIATGWCDARSFVAISPKQALELAAFISHGRENSVISVHDNVVVELTAKSQSYDEMGKDAFGKSKEDVIEYCAAQVGLTVEELVKASRAAFDARKGKRLK